MKTFHERDPVTVGVVGLTTVTLLTVAAVRIDDLPLIGSRQQYSAAFAEGSGLKGGDEVRIAGIKVGKVDDVRLEGGHVKVTFRLKDNPVFGTQTGAAIRVKTIFGSRYLALTPKGPGRLKTGSEIPLSRTTSGYQVLNAFSDLARTTEQVDTRRLATALDTVSTTFKNSPKPVKDSVEGLSRLSATVASRDDALRRLMAKSGSVSGVLADHTKQLSTLIKDSAALLHELDQRRQAIHALLANSVALSAQLTGLVRDNRRQIGPALERLGAVVEMLRRNEGALDRSVRLLAPLLRVETNTMGSGPWIDNYIQNLVAAP